jgi:hypothetical protein
MKMTDNAQKVKNKLFFLFVSIWNFRERNRSGEQILNKQFGLTSFTTSVRKTNKQRKVNLFLLDVNFLTFSYVVKTNKILIISLILL